MASKITRKTASIFGGSLTAAPDGIEAFGTTANGGAVYTIDPAVIQNNYWLEGWQGAAKNNYPVLEDLNAVDYVNSYQLAYLLQQGIAEWDSGTYYFINSICSYNGEVYISTQNSNLNNNPSSSSGYWQITGNSAQRGPNLFRNGLFQVNQRGTSGTVTAGSPVYTSDGWIIGSTGANVAWQSVYSFAIGGGEGTQFNGNSLQLYSVSTQASDVFLKQRIASAVVADQLNGAYYITVQFSIYNQTGSSFTPKLTVNVPTSGSPDNWSSGSTPVSGLNGVSLQECGGGETIVSYTFQASYQSIMSNIFANGIEIVLDLGGAVTVGTGFSNAISIFGADCCFTNYLNTAGLQANPPALQPLTYELELKKCLYYFQSYGGDSSNQVFGRGSVLEGSYQLIMFNLSDIMFNVPTLTISAVSDFGIYYEQNATNTCTVLEIQSGAFGKAQGLLFTQAGSYDLDVPVSLCALNTNARLMFSAEL